MEQMYVTLIDDDVDLVKTNEESTLPPQKTRIKSVVQPERPPIKLTEHPFNRLAVKELYATNTIPSVHDSVHGSKSGDLALVRLQNTSDEPITLINPRIYVEGEKATTLGKWYLQKIMVDLVGEEEAKNVSSLAVLRDSSTDVHETVESGEEIIMSRFAMAVSVFVYSRMTATFGGHITDDNNSVLAEGSRFCIKFTPSGASQDKNNGADSLNFLNSDISSSAFWKGRAVGQRYKTIKNGGMVDVSLKSQDHSTEMTWLSFNNSDNNPYQYTKDKDKIDWQPVAYELDLVKRFDYFYGGAGSAIRKVINESKTSVIDTVIHEDYRDLEKEF